MSSAIEQEILKQVVTKAMTTEQVDSIARAVAPKLNKIIEKSIIDVMQERIYDTVSEFMYESDEVHEHLRQTILKSFGITPKAKTTRRR